MSVRPAVWHRRLLPLSVSKSRAETKGSYLRLRQIMCTWNVCPMSSSGNSDAARKAQKECAGEEIRFFLFPLALLSARFREALTVAAAAATFEPLNRRDVSNFSQLFWRARRLLSHSSRRCEAPSEQSLVTASMLHFPPRRLVLFTRRFTFSSIKLSHTGSVLACRK